MMKRLKVTTAIMVVLLFVSSVHAEDFTLESAPPVVLKTLPEAGAAGVDASTAEIRVTFSKAMQDGTWSWASASPQSFPELNGKPKYDDARTCVLPVKLQPGKTYTLWINTQKLLNFKDTKGQPSIPYLLVFKTRA